MDMNKLEGIASSVLGFARVHAYAERVVVVASMNYQGRMEAHATVKSTDGREVAVTVTDPPDGGDCDAAED